MPTAELGGILARLHKKTPRPVGERNGVRGNPQSSVVPHEQPYETNQSLRGVPLRRADEAISIFNNEREALHSIRLPRRFRSSQ